MNELYNHFWNILKHNIDYKQCKYMYKVNSRNHIIHLYLVPTVIRQVRFYLNSILVIAMINPLLPNYDLILEILSFF